MSAVEAGPYDSMRGRRQAVLTSSLPLSEVACGGVFLDSEELEQELCDPRDKRQNRPRGILGVELH